MQFLQQTKINMCTSSFIFLHNSASYEHFGDLHEVFTKEINVK